MLDSAPIARQITQVKINIPIFHSFLCRNNKARTHVVILYVTNYYKAKLRCFLRPYVVEDCTNRRTTITWLQFETKRSSSSLLKQSPLFFSDQEHCLFSLSTTAIIIYSNCQKNNTHNDPSIFLRVRLDPSNTTLPRVVGGESYNSSVVLLILDTSDRCLPQQ